MTEKILVTGASGFLGSNLVRKLTSEGYSVRILRRASSSLDALSGCEFEEVIGDITNPASVTQAVRGCKIVFHSAAIIQYWDHKNSEQSAVNVEGTRYVVEACLQLGVTRLIHVSSVVAIGYDPAGGVADEKTEYNMRSLRMNYADSKYAAEQIVLDGVEAGLDAVIVNPATIYGPGDYRRAAYVRGMANFFTARGGMAVVDVDDVVDGCLRAWKRGKKGERYILSSENLSFKEIGKELAQHMGHKGPRFVVPSWLVRFAAWLLTPLGLIVGDKWSLTPTMARAAHVRFAYNNEKAEQELGMKFIPFPKAAKRTVEWMREQGLC